MSSLRAEVQRLFVPLPAASAEAAGQPAALMASPNLVRAMVMELARPASWKALSKVWYGVQSELGLPAPAIAVSGTDGLQLWFSLEQPIEAARAHAFLDTLQTSFMPDVDADRVRLMPDPDATIDHPEKHALPVPALREPGGYWSAFVAPDLAPVFADTPWLDIPPNEDGQATLLRSLDRISEDALATALKRLGSAPMKSQSQMQALSPAPPSAEKRAVSRERKSLDAAADDARGFLLRIMNDESVPLALRMDAAKALLQASND